jgi:hypothetical protein
MARLPATPWLLFIASIFLFASLTSAPAQVSLPVPHSRVVQTVDDLHLTTLAGNTHPLARSEFDRGPLDDAAPLHRMVLVLKRSADQETALKQLIDQQQDKSSSNYLQWLTPESFGVAFGPSDRDLSAVTTWLASHGFANIQVNAARTFLEFTGNAGAVRTTFHTSMHRYDVHGQQHFANASDPEIPTALAPVIAGVASLNNFPRRAANRRLGNFRRDLTTNATTRLPDSAAAQTQANATLSQPSFTFGSESNTSYGVTPYDFATIYNVLPLWNQSTPIDGTGQTIAIVGETDINPADFVNFRKLFGLPLGNTATATGTQFLNVFYNGPNPGVTDDEAEADIDTQWSGAVAKGATIDYVVSQSTEIMQGTDLSAIYIVDHNLTPVMSYSYGECELFLGSAGNAFYNTLWQQAAAQGITVLVASGDSGSAGCDDAGANGATDGVAVNGLGSTPYNVAVGGTDFYMPNGGTAFWNSTNNSSTQASAKGYIPEAPWNQSCTNSVFATAGTFSGETPEQVCNNPAVISGDLTIVTGGGGGASACTQSNEISPASCTGGYGKPPWQTGSGVPADGSRDVPDVSLFASAGFFGAFYVICQQSGNPDGQPCSLTDFAGYGGTSVASPAFAGILSMVSQKTGSRMGNADYVLYSLANQQARSGIACNSATGTPAAGCIFNDVTTGTIAMPCVKGTPNCTVINSSDRYGVLSGFSSGTGYDLATGLGSVNAANLVNSWANSTFVSSTTTLALAPVTITHGGVTSAIVEVSSNSGTPTGGVSIGGLAASSPVVAGSLASGSYAASLGNLPGGSYSVQAHYVGDGVHAASDSNSITLLVTPEASTVSLQPLLYSTSSGGNTAISTAPYGSRLLLRANVNGLSGQGTATGNIVFADKSAPLAGGIFRLDSAASVEDQTALLAPGVHTISALYSGDNSFSASQSAPVALTITKAATISTFNASLLLLSANSTTVLTVQIVPQTAGYGVSPSGTVTVNSDSTVLASTTLSQASAGDTAILLTASQLSVGANPITVAYSGDSNYAGSVSAPIALTVTGSPAGSASTVSIAVSSTTAVQGTAVSITSTVGPVSPTPTGTAQLLIDGNLAGVQVLLSGPTVTLPLNTTTLQPGSHDVEVDYFGDSNHPASHSLPATLNVLPPAAGFTLSSSTAALTAAQGTTSSTVTFTATPMRGFQSTITFACTGGLPSGATCLFTPSSVAITSSAAATTTLTIALVASGGEIPDTQASTHPAVVSVGGGVTLAGLILLVIPRRYHGFTRLRRLLVVLVALSPFAFITGCGSGVTQSSTAGQSAITTGAYTVIVTASGGSATQATTVKLTVQ